MAAVFAAAAGVFGALALRARAPLAPSILSEIQAPPETTFNLENRQPGPPALSRDGRLLAFAARDKAKHVFLWVRRLDMGAARRLDGTEGASYPFWSPDGRFLGFFADGSLKKISAEGGPILTLAAAPFGKGGTWNRDGVIVFSPSYGTPLERISAEGGPSKPVTQLEVQTDASGSFGHRFPQFLPDEKRFLFFARGSVAGKGARSASDPSTDVRRRPSSPPPPTASTRPECFFSLATTPCSRSRSIPTGPGSGAKPAS